MTIRIGVGGWTYEPWRDGTFYPAGLPQKSELEYASRALTAIEINATYYGRQKPQSWEKWAAAVPDGSVFSLKASQYTTRRKVLAEGGETVRKFLEQGFTVLGDKLGPVNWQFKDGKRFDREDFARFLDLIPDQQDGVRLRHALEVRDESFHDPAFLDLARARNMAVVFADRADFPSIAEQTADFTYARLQCSRDEEPAGYTPAELDRWERQAQEWAMGGRDVFVFFIGGAKHRNPAAALELIERLA